MLNASNAVENQKVSICRLSDENKSLITKAIAIAVVEARNFQKKHKLNNSYLLPRTLDELYDQIMKGKEIWLIES